MTKFTPFKADLGIVPFHLGCNAGFAHGNCGICRPSLKLAGKVG